jgi:putative transposase
MEGNLKNLDLEVSRMMEPLEFSLWCDERKFSELARKVIEEIRSSEPVRNRQSRVGNWTGRFASDKMGRTIQFESRTPEFPAVVSYEHGDEVFEFYDQPSKIELRYVAKSGRPIACWHTPDFFVLSVKGAGWEEWKPEEKLVELAESQPGRYQRDEQGHWRCPPGERYAARYGLTYRVRSSSELNPIYIRNLNFLEDYLCDPQLQVEKTALKVMRDLFADEPVMTLKVLLEHVEAQHIYMALLRKHFYVDLYAAPLADSEYVHIFRDEQVAKGYIIMSESPYRSRVSSSEEIEVGIGQGIVWDGRAWTIYNHGDTSFALRSERGDWVEVGKEEFYALASQGKIAQPIQKGHANIGGVNDVELAILAKATTQDYREANERYRLLQRYRAGETPEQVDVPYSTLRDWAVKEEKAELEYGHGYIGLLTKYQRGGNTERKLPDVSLKVMMDFIENDYETDRQKPKVHSWGQMVRYCESKGIHPPSYKTYCKEIKKRKGYEQTLKRRGRRAAYQEKVPYLFLDQDTPRHGDFPWQIVHLDHFEPDIQLVSSRTGKVLGKPWASVMTDANSRRPLAVYLTFDPPSRRSDMMVIRECVRRYKRLPQILVVDGGSDFNSTYFEALLAYHNITKFERPAADPRAGSVEERLFGTTKTGFIDNALGNTKALKNPREMTRSVDPRRKATWTLAAFYRRLCQWCYDVYDNNYHTTLERTPREEYDAGITLSGVRPYRDVEYDLKFLMQTLPISDRGEKLQVHYRKGVQVHYEFYRSKKLDDVAGTEVEVRTDPFDISRVFAFVKGEWTLCEAAHFLALRHHSERELQLISDELRRRRSVSAQQYPITIKRIAEFLASVEAEEQFGIQQMCDAESRDILQAIDVSYAAQFPLFQVSSPILSPDEVEDDDNESVVDNEEIYGDYE